MVVLGNYLKAKFDSLDLIDLLFTLMLEKEENLWGHWAGGFSFEEGQGFAPLVFIFSSK